MGQCNQKRVYLTPLFLSCLVQPDEFFQQWELPCGFSTVVGLGFISKSLSNVIKCILNSDPLSKMTSFGQGYRLNQTWLKSWLILAELLSM